MKSVDVTGTGPMILAKYNITVPARTIAGFSVKDDLNSIHTDQVYEAQTNALLNDEHQNLIHLFAKCGVHDVQSDQMPLVVIHSSAENTYL